ncbi:hypothetical protein QUA32_19780 [Microcoleus sp. Pol14D6]
MTSRPSTQKSTAYHIIWTGLVQQEQARFSNQIRRYSHLTSLKTGFRC